MSIDFNPYILSSSSPKYTYRTHLSLSLNRRYCNNMAEPKVPLDKKYPNVYLEFDLLPGVNWGHNVKSMIMRGMANAGYVIEIEITDPEGAIMTSFIKEGYFENSRTVPLEITFAYLTSPNKPDAPQYGTERQVAIVVHTEYYTPQDDRTNISFIAIDPVSFYLNMGSAGGESYRGRLDEVISQVVKKYANYLTLKMDKTKDSSINRYWMMRQDPKTFISSMLEWSSSLNSTKTNWIVQADGYNMFINDQGSMISKKRGYYTRFAESFNYSISSADTVANNALNLSTTKLVSPGSSAYYGEALDRVTDQEEIYTVAKDRNTEKKQYPKVRYDHSFLRPMDDPDSKQPYIGMTHIMPIPEYTSHDMGMDYKDYISGRARELYLQLLPSIFKAKIVVKGHGEYINTVGLGVDTIFIDWNKTISTDDPDKDYYMSGTWIIYGFEHTFKSATWYTTLYIYRTDKNAEGKRLS